MRAILCMIVLVFSLGNASAYSFSEGDYNLMVSVPHDMSTFSGTEKTYTIGLNIYTGGPVILTSESGYTLCLDPSLISYSCDILSNGPGPVPDNPPLSIIAPPDIIMDSAEVLTMVDLGSPTVIDLVDPSPVVVNDADNEGFPFGITIVTWTATDALGNSATAQQSVTINEVATDTDPVNNDIPEFPTIALPVIAIISLMFLFQRKRDT